MITRGIVLSISLVSAAMGSAQSFADLQGTWDLDKSWEANTLIFDADSDLVYLSYAFGQAMFLSQGSSPQDSAFATERARQRFRELKHCTLIIHPDGSFGTSDFGRGHIIKEQGGWLLIPEAQPEERIPLRIKGGSIEFTSPAEPRMRMLFIKHRS